MMMMMMMKMVVVLLMGVTHAGMRAFGENARNTLNRKMVSALSSRPRVSHILNTGKRLMDMVRRHLVARARLVATA